MQVYRYLNIGTAKIKPEETQGITHHLLDIKEPTENFSVAEFKKMAEEKIEEIVNRNKFPMLVGGTGLYIKSVIDNYVFCNVAAKPEFRQKMWAMADKRGPKYIWTKLFNIDPTTANGLHPNDTKRIIRALEVYNFTGYTMTDWKKNQPQESPYDFLMFGLYCERENMYGIINRRVDKMIELGLAEEVRQLLQMGYSPDTNSMQGLGYKELIPHIKGEITLMEAIATLKRNTRRFAKRQLTWFNKDPRINWIKTDGDGLLQTVDEIGALVAGKFNLVENNDSK